eukprot:12059930-Karenia_brevis.AAC.1
MPLGIGENQHPIHRSSSLAQLSVEWHQRELTMHLVLRAGIRRKETEKWLGSQACRHLVRRSSP